MKERPPLDDTTVARLLSGRDSPSVLEKEALFERIVASVEGQEAPRAAQAARTRWGFLWASGLAGSAVLGLVGLWLARSTPPELVARGAPTSALELELSCGSAETPCHVGGSLSLELGGLGSKRFFAAFARRQDGAIIWYFPEPAQRSLALAPQQTHFVLERKVVLGPEHTPGSYELFGVFSSRALTRDELKQLLGDHLEGGPELEVTRRSFEVLP